MLLCHWPIFEENPFLESELAVSVSASSIPNSFKGETFEADLFAEMVAFFEKYFSIINFKSLELKNHMKKITDSVIKYCLKNNKHFNFSISKKEDFEVIRN